MISKTIKRYVWLLNLLIEHGRLTFEEIDLYWSDCPLSEGKSLALRTFHEHRKAIEELFGVEIKCDKAKNQYYVDSMLPLTADKTLKWLYNSFALSNTIDVDYVLYSQNVVIRVYGIFVEHLRTVPLHNSQKEIRTNCRGYSDFQYKLCLTPELTDKILLMGENVEVREPEALRETIKKKLQLTMNRYK